MVTPRFIQIYLIPVIRFIFQSLKTDPKPYLHYIRHLDDRPVGSSALKKAIPAMMSRRDHKLLRYHIGGFGCKFPEDIDDFGNYGVYKLFLFSLQLLRFFLLFCFSPFESIDIFEVPHS